MAQVREILFGAQLKDMEMRFRRQEERFLREIGEVRESLRGRLDSLENFMKSEVSSLLNRLKEEKDERENALRAEERDRHEEVRKEAQERETQHDALKRDLQDALARESHDRADSVSRLQAELNATNESFERRATKLAQSLDSTERSLRELFMRELAALSDKIDEKYNELLSVLGKTSSQIRSDMVYRTALSTMLTEMVASLSKPWNLDIEDAEDGSDEVYEAESEEARQGETASDSESGGGWDGGQS
jgi:exonuclease VII large subunit